MLKNFDKRFLLLIFPLLRTSWPRIQYMTREVVPFAMVVLFIVSFLFVTKAPPAPRRLKMAFFWMMLWYVVFAFSNSIFALFSYGELLPYHAYASHILTIIFLYAFYVALVYRKYNELKVLMVIVLVGTLFSGISAGQSGEITSRQLLLNSMSRGDYNSEWGRYDALKAGLGGYGHVYANAMSAGLLLLMVASRSVKKHARVFFGVAFVAMCIVVKKGGLGTAVAVLGLSVSLAVLAWSGRSARVLKVAGALACLAFFIYAVKPSILSPLSLPLNMMAENMAPGAIRDRVASAAESVSGNENTYAYARAQLFVQSMNVFLDNPLIGVGAYQQGHKSGDILGGHSVIMDMLAQEGLVGLLILIMFFSSAFKYFNEVAKSCGHPDWNVLPAIYLLCLLYVMFSNQMGRGIDGFFLTVAFGYLAMLMQTDPRQSRNWHKFERWRV